MQTISKVDHYAWRRLVLQLQGLVRASFPRSQNIANLSIGLATVCSRHRSLSHCRLASGTGTSRLKQQKTRGVARQGVSLSQAERLWPGHEALRAQLFQNGRLAECCEEDPPACAQQKYEPLMAHRCRDGRWKRRFTDTGNGLHLADLEDRFRVSRPKKRCRAHHAAVIHRDIHLGRRHREGGQGLLGTLIFNALWNPSYPVLGVLSISGYSMWIGCVAELLASNGPAIMAMAGGRASTSSRQKDRDRSRDHEESSWPMQPT